ncbi:universal stress protein [Roseisolibacter sp. H3M3-2]|uniref:universal stress protein n=1 Tax=Roseisolibacter sp. H3M3-2 TaxID=3031323 RepID=UPI0023DC3623|nr:universal stress protein [Roseisolibacter sp. H3M3-2]MDF1502218.1 universal stress protein [Roseisolibacter sp. H3M3-2]
MSAVPLPLPELPAPTARPVHLRPPRPAPSAATVLVASDGRPEALGAVRTAAHLATHLRATPELLAVVPPVVGYGMEADAMLALALEQEQREAVRRSVDAQRAAVGVAGDGWEPAVRVGPPAVAIADAARGRAALVVMGIGRHRLSDRLLGGETALRVLRMADAPVLAVPTTADGRFRRAVVAVDFSLPSVRAAESAAMLLAPGGMLSLVHVRPQVDHPSATAAAWDEAAGRRVRELLARLRARLERLARGENAGAPGRPPTIGDAVFAGDPAEELIGYAQCVGADLVAVGSQGTGALSRLLLGSVTADVLRGVAERMPECAVLAAPAPRAAAAAERLERELLGTSEWFDRGEWGLVLRGFAERNAGRRAVLEIDDVAVGAQVAVRGYPLVGAAYDPHDGRVEVMLGDPREPRRHLTRSLGALVSVAVCTGLDGRDAALRLEHRGGGQTLVRFEE